MVFSSLVFLFVFLPIILFLYYLAKPIYRNFLLLIASLLFYAWGEPIYVFLMIGCIIINYLLGLQIVNQPSRAKMWLIIAVVFNIGMLIGFKYTNFLVTNVNYVFDTNIDIKNIALPLGISFFTFQAMSYVIDVYRGDAKVQKSIFDLGLYVSLFPQLVAGPIVRYQTVADQITHREHVIGKFGEGVLRFIVGMGKKVLIANNVGMLADTIFAIPQDQLPISTAWLGIIAYTLQIFFDFSGYSDMAIGLGKMFGFDFLENFNYPYISQSVTEFWRRWHISLGSWFRDYVYIPLGGNRRGPIRTYINLFIVWLVTGLWHGANWTFIAWGLYFGILIMMEKAFLGKILERAWRPIRHIYLVVIVMIGWVLFRADTFTYAADYIKVLMGISGSPFYNSQTLVYLNDYFTVVVLGIVFSVPWLKVLGNRLKQSHVKWIENPIIYCLESIVYLGILWAVIIQLVNSTYNPFLYFKF